MKTIAATGPASPAARAATVQASDGSSAIRRIGRLDVAAVTGPEAVGIIELALDEGLELHVGFANAHCVNIAANDDLYARAMSRFLVLPDGIGVDLGSRLLFGEPFPQNLNGTDFVPFLLASTARPLRVALLGGKPGIAEEAAARFATRFPRHRFLPVGHGYFEPGVETGAAVAQLRLVRADIVLVALGVPRQEIFIARHLTRRDVPVAIAVGALLDFTAGKVARAPRAVRRLRSEWLWRLLMEPRRLAQRYIAGNPAFLWRMARQMIGRGSDGR